MTRLDLTPAEADALSGLLSLAENVNEYLDEAEASLAVKLDSPPPPPEGRYAEPRPGATSWDEAFPPLTEGAADLILHEILFDAAFARMTIECADNPLAVTLLDMLETFRGNCWADQHEGGAHRQDLIDVNRLVRYLGDPDGDDLAAVLALPPDDTRP